MQHNILLCRVRLNRFPTATSASHISISHLSNSINCIKTPPATSSLSLSSKHFCYQILNLQIYNFFVQKFKLQNLLFLPLSVVHREKTNKKLSNYLQLFVAMNIFRFAGDMTHLISILVLLLKIYATKSCSGYAFSPQFDFLI